MDAEVVDFQLLSDDYSKMALLCADRAVRVHARFGAYHSVRTPRQGRTIAYDAMSAEALVAGSAPQIWRLNLSRGSLMSPLHSASPAVNVLGRSPALGILVAGGDDGVVECFDVRQRTAIGRLVLSAGRGEEVTAVRFSSSDAVRLAIGTSKGEVQLYDLRSSKPLLRKDHRNGEPIVDLKFPSCVGDSGGGHHLREGFVVSADKRAAKVWSAATGESLVTIQPPAESGEINDLCILPRSGLVFLAMDAPHLLTYFVPQLGPAPAWGSFLEHVTEEMEEATMDTVFVDYKVWFTMGGSC